MRNEAHQAQAEAAEALTDLKAVYGELFPDRNPDNMRVDDAALTLAVLIRREFKAAPAQPEIGRTFKPHGKILDRIARHDPKDAE